MRIRRPSHSTATAPASSSAASASPSAASSGRFRRRVRFRVNLDVFTDIVLAVLLFDRSCGRRLIRRRRTLSPVCAH